MSNEIILYDLPSSGPRTACWSLNPWKARASLNYKQLPYKTEWIEYPDLAPTLSSFGVKANTNTTTSLAEYFSPAAQLPDGSVVMDSRKIAEALDKLQPEPSLHMADAADVIDRTQAAVLGIHQNLAPVTMPRIPSRLLNPRSAEYFSSTRAKRYGMTLPELAKSDKGGENAWRNAQPHFEALAKVLKEKDGPYVLGEEPSFADFIVAGFWHFVKKLDDGGDLFGRGTRIDESFGKHYEACKKWFERDD